MMTMMIVVVVVVVVVDDDVLYILCVQVFSWHFPKLRLHRVRSTAISLKFQYLRFS
jgi:hypothetical protein